MRVILSMLISLLTFSFRSRRSLELEVIALRHQLCVLKRRQRHLPPMSPADRFIWSWLYRTYPQAVQWMQLVKPATVVEWHRCGYLYYWRRRSAKGHLPWKVKGQLRHLIVQMYNENAGWGSGRIQGELLKLGYSVTKQTVAKYLRMFPGAPPPGWRVFLRNHMHDAAAIDMFVVISLSFRLLYAMVVIRLDRREILRVNATEHPTAEWLSNEVTETFKRIAKPKYLIRDRDSAYGLKFSKRMKELGIREHVVDKQSPWQNIYVERVIWTIRRECLNHMIIVGERHLRRILRSYVDYYNKSRPHLSLAQDSPVPRPVQSLSDGNRVDAIPQVGGLHHLYKRRLA